VSVRDGKVTLARGGEAATVAAPQLDVEAVDAAPIPKKQKERNSINIDVEQQAKVQHAYTAAAAAELQGERGVKKKSKDKKRKAGALDHSPPEAAVSQQVVEIAAEIVEGEVASKKKKKKKKKRRSTAALDEEGTAAAAAVMQQEAEKEAAGGHKKERKKQQKANVAEAAPKGTAGSARPSAGPVRGAGATARPTAAAAGGLSWDDDAEAVEEGELNVLANMAALEAAAEERSTVAWRADLRRTDVKSGPFSAAEKEAIKAAVLGYAATHGHSTEDFSWLFEKGGDKGQRVARGTMWKTIASALPNRTFKAVHQRVTRTFHPHNYLVRSLEWGGVGWGGVGGAWGSTLWQHSPNCMFIPSALAVIFNSRPSACVCLTAGQVDP
jgi:hypothetical protein